MNKSIILMGMLAVGFANAQQYDGKVGVNTDTPSATLNVKSKTGTNGATKNFELQNAADKKLVTVLDNANVGINNDKPAYLLDITGTDNSYARNSIALRGFRTDGSIGIDLYKARGTKEAPAIVEQNDLAGHFGFTTYNGAKYMASGSFVGRVTGEITPDKAVPVSLDFRVVRNFADANISNANIAMRVYHDGNIGMGTIEPTHKLHIKPDAGQDPLKLEGLQSTTDATAKNLVVVDGVVKMGNVSTGATTIGKTDNIECTEANRGKMNFAEVTKSNGKKTDVLGVCMKNEDGNYYWRYFYGAMGTSTGSGAFGSTGIN